MFYKYIKNPEKSFTTPECYKIQININFNGFARDEETDPIPNQMHLGDKSF